MVDFAKTFGAPASGTAAPAATNERTPSQFWLNVGMTAGEGETERFVSLPMGIALDSQKPIAVRGSNEDFNAFTVARNDLLDQLQTVAASLAPGEEKIVGLQVQLRRISDPVEAPAMTDENAYKIELSI